MKSRKSGRQPSTRRATKDLAPKETSQIKGGFEAVEHKTMTPTVKKSDGDGGNVSGGWSVAQGASA